MIKSFLVLLPFLVSGALAVDNRIPVNIPEGETIEELRADWTETCTSIAAPVTPNIYAYDAPAIYTQPAANVFCTTTGTTDENFTDAVIEALGLVKATYKD